MSVDYGATITSHSTWEIDDPRHKDPVLEALREDVASIEWERRKSPEKVLVLASGDPHALRPRSGVDAVLIVPGPITPEAEAEAIEDYLRRWEDAEKADRHIFHLEYDHYPVRFDAYGKNGAWYFPYIKALSKRHPEILFVVEERVEIYSGYTYVLKGGKVVAHTGARVRLPARLLARLKRRFQKWRFAWRYGSVSWAPAWFNEWRWRCAMRELDRGLLMMDGKSIGIEKTRATE
jgi:hypothetical protein